MVDRFRVLLRWDAFVLLVLAILCVISRVVYLTASPAWANDEFFYLQGGKAIVNGQTLYRDFVDLKPPLIFFLSALVVKVVGFAAGLAGMKVVVLLVETLSAFAFFKLGERLADRWRGFLSALCLIVALGADTNAWPMNAMALALLPVGAYACLLATRGPALTASRLVWAGVFLGIGAALSTNLVLLALLLPVLHIFAHKMPTTIVRHALWLTMGFALPVVAIAWYFAQRHGLGDWYWWNITWAKYYVAEQPIYLRLPFFFASCLLSWQWIPLYALAILGAVSMFRRRHELDPQAIAFVVTFAVLVLALRLPLGRLTARYNPYLLPILVVLVMFIDLTKVRRWMAYSAIILLGATFIANNTTAAVSPYGKKAEPHRVVNEWLAQHTPYGEKVFVWYEGFDVYHGANVDMATGFFSCGQHLNQTDMFAALPRAMIDAIWQKFFDQLAADRPLYIVDMTGNFSRYNEAERVGPMKERMEELKKVVADKYRRLANTPAVNFGPLSDQHATFDPVAIYIRL